MRLLALRGRGGGRGDGTRIVCFCVWFCMVVVVSVVMKHAVFELHGRGGGCGDGARGYLHCVVVVVGVLMEHAVICIAWSWWRAW